MEFSDGVIGAGCGEEGEQEGGGPGGGEDDGDGSL